MNILSPGARIGQYEIASLPMMGGMGVVYFALDHGNDGRPVALKTFRPELLPDRAARDRFLREGTAWIELGSHPHIVRCYKVEYIDPTAFLVLELIAKEQNMPDASLRSWLIPGQPLPLEQTLLFALQIARGMQHATEKIPGFVHRDLKPENILVGADKLPGTNINRLRVTDFGLVKTIAGGGITATSGDEKELKPTQIQFTRGVGTPLYMAPEQWKGEPVGVFTDIYAFGCILYEMLSGWNIANGETITDLQLSHCHGNLKAMPTNLSKDMMELIKKCLNINASQRYLTWLEIINELSHLYVVQTGQKTLMLPENTMLDRDEKVQEAWSNNAIGGAYVDIGSVLSAKGHFEKALTIAVEIEDSWEESASLVNLGNVYFFLGDMQKAVSYYEKALVVSNRIGDQRGKTAILSGLANTYLNTGDLKRALENYEKALSISHEIADLYLESVILNSMGEAYRNLGELLKGIGYYERALGIARNINRHRVMSTILCNIGSAYFQLGNVGYAIDYYQQALSIDREIGDRHGEGADLNNLANVYLQTGELQEAIGYYEQALIIKRETSDRHGEGNTLDNLGNVYARLGDLQRALKYYEDAISIRHEVGDVNGLATDYFNLALLYTQQDDATRAFPLAQEAKRIWMQIGSPNAQYAQQLVSQIQQSEVLDVSSFLQAAFEAFQCVNSIEELAIAVEKYPIIVENEFIEAVEDSISENVPREQKPAFEQRLSWLRQIAARK